MAIRVGEPPGSPGSYDAILKYLYEHILWQHQRMIAHGDWRGWLATLLIITAFHTDIEPLENRVRYNRD